MSEKDENMEQSFNDAELQDIMNEIESLEKEFVEEEGGQPEEVQASAEEPAAEQTVEAAPETSEEPQAEETQEEPQASEHNDEEQEDFAAEAATYEAEEAPESNVVPMTAAKATPATGTGEGYMQFSGQGDMDMQLNFQLGQETAAVNIKGGCLNVTLAGVQLELSENGCEVQMEGGVKFSVPLTGSQAQGKKAA